MTGPSLYDFAGGADAMRALAEATTHRCLADPELNHAFSHGMRPDHDDRLGWYFGEVFGGPAEFTAHGGTQSDMVRMHAGNHEPDDWKDRFLACFLAAIDDAGLPADPEFRDALRAYMQWSVADTMAFPDSAADVPAELTIPQWSWHGLVAS